MKHKFYSMLPRWFRYWWITKVKKQTFVEWIMPNGGTFDLSPYVKSVSFGKMDVTDAVSAANEELEKMQLFKAVKL